MNGQRRLDPTEQKWDARAFHSEHGVTGHASYSSVVISLSPGISICFSSAIGQQADANGGMRNRQHGDKQNMHPRQKCGMSTTAVEKPAEL